MSPRAQQGSVALALAAILLLAACADTPTAVGDQSSPSPSVPAIHIKGLHETEDTLDAELVAGEATHPQPFEQELASLGFLGAAERTLAGRRGVFSRVVVRGWSFDTEEHAAAFLAWLQGNVHELIGVATPTTTAHVPEGVWLFVHEPTGCCHEEVPIYLAAWQRGPVVWTVRASGARIRMQPVLDLIETVEKET
jgi:hypothetical protein